MNKNYGLKLDLQIKTRATNMTFDEFDNNTSDFHIKVVREGKQIDLNNKIASLLVVRPNGTTDSQVLEIIDNTIYGNLKPSLKNQVGTYIGKILLVEGDKKIFLDGISYKVTENALLGQVDEDLQEDPRFSILSSLIERLSDIELSENSRVEAEKNRVEAENLRQEAIEKIKNDIDFLINETNKKVNDNLNTNASKIDNLIIDTKEELNEYKNNKDIAINKDLKEFKENTNKSIENYKTSKDIEIDNILNTYKTNTTNDISSFKNTVNSKIDKYKNDKDKAINEHIEAKELELDNYVEAKNNEIDNYKTSKNNEIDLYISEKNTLIDSKISEVDVVKEQLQNSVNSKLIEVDNAEKQRQEEHEERQQFLDGFEGKLNTVVDDVANIKDDVVSVKEANKRQDIFLQGLYNENLDGRVTVKEEGSVISLTNSDDGLVDVVGLEGNTLVNYVQDGAKELALNGDIDVEGANVTLTEGVDNGLVDVTCEGNTLVNLLPNKELKITCNNDWDNFYATGRPNVTSGINFGNIIQDVKPNTTYTFIYNVVTRPTSNYYLINNPNTHTVFDTYVRVYSDTPLGINKVVLTTPPDLTDKTIVLRQQNSAGRGEVYIKDYMLLEGDWTNKEIPTGYFEGMKSVGECEDNKLEIVSQNKNLIDPSTFEHRDIGIRDIIGLDIRTKTGYYSEERVLTTVKVKPNTEYTFSVDNTSDTFQTFIGFANENFIGVKNEVIWAKLPNNNKYHTFTTTMNTHYLYINTHSNYNLQLQEGGLTSYTPYNSNKKEITLSEPLRALPNGVKDKIVKIGGKWYVERNCGITIADGNKNYILDNVDLDTRKNISAYFTIEPQFVNDYREISNKLLTSSFVECKYDALTGSIGDLTGIGTMCGSGSDTQRILISMPKTNLTSLDVNGFRQWLQDNPLTIIHQLATPIYEELPISPTLNTYTDITHISNNSTIPCNMKITNTGYNAIIKPSTQYTIAFDTNTSGEVGINLGGSKVTTTNNVATVTTPSVLVDDSLRLTGKGIKASKVRLLESDKTNWIPSHFEGMKSSFEDKLQDDGTFKMEILSNNKNLLNIEKMETGIPAISHPSKISVKNNRIELNNDGEYWIRGFYKARVKPNTTYTFTSTITKGMVIIYKSSHLKDNFSWNADYIYGYKNYTNKTNAECTIKFTTDSDEKYVYIRFSNEGVSGVSIFNDPMIVKGESKTEYMPHKSNKIQFSSIEPLRGVGDVKDRFVFKDGRLMIERNVKEIILQSTNLNTLEIKHDLSSDKFLVFTINNLEGRDATDRYSITSNKFASMWTLRDLKAYCEGMFGEDSNHNAMAYISIDKRRLTTFDKQGIEEWLIKNKITLIYPLIYPIYEEVPHELQKIILEGYVNGTLFLDTNIPPTVTSSYTANIPLVSKVNKVNETTETNTEDIAITQMAVDFLLMSTLGEEMLNFKVRSGYNMASYFASRIIKGALKYEDVINKYPQYKKDINSILISEGYSDLIIEL